MQLAALFKCLEYSNFPTQQIQVTKFFSTQSVCVWLVSLLSKTNMSATLQIVNVESQRTIMWNRCQVPMAANRKTRPVAARLRVPFKDVHERAACLSNVWICMHTDFCRTAFEILRIPMDIQSMVHVGEETVEITYSIPWDSYVQDGQMLDGGLCVKTNLYCTIETVVFESVQQRVDVFDDDLVDLVQTSTSTTSYVVALQRMNEMFNVDFEFQNYKDMDAACVDTVHRGTVEITCRMPAFFTADEWKSGKVFAATPRKLERISLFYSGDDTGNFPAKIKEHVRDVTAVHVCHNDKRRRYASQYQLLCGQNSRLFEIVKLLEREAIMTPRVLRLIEAFCDEYLEKVINCAVGVIDFHPRVPSGMDIQFVKPEIVDVASTQNESNLYFVLWRQTMIVFCHGICMPALYA